MDSAICDVVDGGVVDIWQIVADVVHARHGHEALCSTLACQNPWYEVYVRGLVLDDDSESDKEGA